MVNALIALIATIQKSEYSASIWKSWQFSGVVVVVPESRLVKNICVEWQSKGKLLLVVHGHETSSAPFCISFVQMLPVLQSKFTILHKLLCRKGVIQVAIH